MELIPEERARLIEQKIFGGLYESACTLFSSLQSYAKDAGCIKEGTGITEPTTLLLTAIDEATGRKVSFHLQKVQQKCADKITIACPQTPQAQPS